MKKAGIMLIVLLCLFLLASCSKKYKEYYSDDTIACYEEQMATIDMYLEEKIDVAVLKKEMKIICNKYDNLDSDDQFLSNAALKASVIAMEIENYELGQRLGTGKTTLVELEKKIKDQRQQIEERLYE